VIRKKEPYYTDINNLIKILKGEWKMKTRNFKTNKQYFKFLNKHKKSIKVYNCTIKGDTIKVLYSF
jgi:hypothetical protein